MQRAGDFCPPGARALAGTCVDEFIQNDQIVALGKRREKSEIRDIAAAEEKRSFSMKERRRRDFEFLMLWRVSPEQSRAAGPNGATAKNRRADGARKALRCRES